MSTSMAFPTVDVSRTGTVTAREVDRICRETGFLAAVGHGVSTALVEDVWGTAAGFFDLPLEKKMRVAMPFPGYPDGYSPFAKEPAMSRGETTPDPVETSASARVRQEAPLGPSQGFTSAPTLWPEEPERLEEVFRRYFSEMGELSSRILSLFALALERPSDFFAHTIDRHASALRALDYPALESAPSPGQLRAGAHSDYGSLTVLLAEPGSRGLEIAPTATGKRSHRGGRSSSISATHGKVVERPLVSPSIGAAVRSENAAARSPSSISPTGMRRFAVSASPKYLRSKPAPTSWRNFEAPCGMIPRWRRSRSGVRRS
jgi:isopenicillin N synthase-like dioxygenase